MNEQPDPISVEAMKDAPRYELQFDPGQMEFVSTTLIGITEKVVALTKYLARSVPPDYRTNVCYCSTRSISGHAHVSVMFIPESETGLALSFRLLMEEKSDGKEV